MDPCSKETGSKFYFTMQSRPWWQHLVICGLFFFPVFNQAMEIKNEENLFILASTAHLKHFFSKKCAEAIFWSFLALFSLTSLDSRQLVMTSSELQWICQNSLDSTHFCAVQRTSGKIMESYQDQNNLWQHQIQLFWD